MKKKQYRSIFLSDIHLGMRHCQAEKLLDFLKSTEAERYYLVGDIIDGWCMSKKVYWPQSHNNVIQFFLKKSKKIPVIYVTGNHDAFLREYSGTVMGNIQLVDYYIHITDSNKRYLVIHGDQFDIVTMNARWLAMLGGWAYDLMIDINGKLGWLYSKLGCPGFSLAQWSKQNIKEAVSFISDYENAVVDYAEKKDVNGVICGHIHHATIQEYSGIEYINCGDAVESCTAIVENYNGEFEVVYYD